MNFQDFRNKFPFIIGQLCDKKTCTFVVMGIGKRLCGLRWDSQRSSGRQCPICLRACVSVCGAKGGLGGDNQASNVVVAAMIFHDHLHHCEIFLAHFLISFVLNKAAIEFDF